MPSGARKRKAMRRRKEQQANPPPVSPTIDPLPSPPHPPPRPQGNGHGDLMMPHGDGEYETASETPFATPMSQANHPLAEEEGEEVAVGSAMESSGNGSREAERVAAADVEAGTTPKCDLSVEKGEVCEGEGAEGTEVEKPAEEWVTSEGARQELVVSAEIPKEAPAVTDPPPSHNWEVRVVPLVAKDGVREQPSYKQDVKVAPLPGEDEIEEPPPYEREREVKVVPLPEEDEAKNQPSYECGIKVVPLPDENEAKEDPSHEHEEKVEPLTDEVEVEEQLSHELEVKVAPLPDEDEIKECPSHEYEVKAAPLAKEDEVKERLSHECEVKVVLLPDENVTAEQSRVSGQASQSTVRAETAPTIKDAPCTLQGVHRARWWNCCGLLDVLVGSER